MTESRAAGKEHACAIHLNLSSHKPDICPITAIVPACQRVESLLKTLRIIRGCSPAPEEIIVHVDGGNKAVVRAVNNADPAVRILTSTVLLGPGGSRNQLVLAAKHELVANFDDDSFPDQTDYFARVLRTASLFPDAAVISAASQIFEREMSGYHIIAVASGCGCVFRKSWFERTRGFVPLPVAYGMEEVDVSLQLHAQGGVVIHDPGLHVKHDKAPPTNVSAKLNAAVIANFALFPYLRYPRMLWIVGFWQVLRRCLYMNSHGWGAGTWAGLQMIPRHLHQYRQYVFRIPLKSMLSWFHLRVSPRLVVPSR